MKLDSGLVTAIQAIQGILAPAVMITGVALLLLTFNARHSSLVNRIRLLNDEKRALDSRFSQSNQGGVLRKRSIEKQLGLLLSRLRYVRDGMLCHMLAVIFFILTSLLIGLGYFSFSFTLSQLMIDATFIAGMFLALCGVAYLALELYVSYRVILVELKEK